MNTTPKVGERPAKSTHDLESIASFAGAVMWLSSRTRIMKAREPLHLLICKVSVTEEGHLVLWVKKHKMFVADSKYSSKMCKAINALLSQDASLELG